MRIQLIGQKEPQWYGSMYSWVKNGLLLNGNEVVESDRKSIIIDNTVDYILIIDCSEDFSGKIPETQKLKVFWSMDAHMPGGTERSVNIARKCDLVFSTNKEHGVDLLKKFGVESILMPITFDPDLVQDPKGKDYQYDITMIGHPNSSERQQLWEILGQYKSFTGIADKEQYINAMNSSRMVVNQPTEPWDIILNNRFFEAMACGALLLQKRLKTTLIEDLGFVEGQDFLYWNNFDELIILINQYKSNLSFLANRGKGIADSGHKKVLDLSIPQQLKKMESIILNQLKK